MTSQRSLWTSSFGDSVTEILFSHSFLKYTYKVWCPWLIKLSVYHNLVLISKYLENREKNSRYDFLHGSLKEQHDFRTNNKILTLVQVVNHENWYSLTEVEASDLLMRFILLKLSKYFFKKSLRIKMYGYSFIQLHICTTCERHQSLKEENIMGS